MSSAPSLLLSACVSVLVALTTARAADPPTATAAVFDNVAARTGLEDVRGARVSFADLDGDLWPDLIVGCSRIFWNRPGAHGRRFVASGITLVPDGARGAQSVQIGDVNDDGHADLFLGRSTDLSNPRFTDDGLRSEIWLGDGKGGFRRVPEAGIER
ncbi:MAG: VCBS repeat-containing protein, partial [Planctomycetota bacterium]